MTELVGWVASFVVLVSMTFKTMWKLRLVNSIACVMWIFYGYLISNNPTIFVNFAILVTHIIWFIKNKVYENQTPASKG
jgi:uncharacterized protein with PQ loop repeat